MRSPRTMTPAAAFKRWAYAEDLIERAIALLDDLDGDPDLEPSMGYMTPGSLDECEPSEDNEPSLGWSVTGATTKLDTHWWTADLEDESE